MPEAVDCLSHVWLDIKGHEWPLALVFSLAFCKVVSLFHSNKIPSGANIINDDFIPIKHPGSCMKEPAYTIERLWKPTLSLLILLITPELCLQWHVWLTVVKAFVKLIHADTGDCYRATWAVLIFIKIARRLSYCSAVNFFCGCVWTSESFCLTHSCSWFPLLSQWVHINAEI